MTNESAASRHVARCSPLIGCRSPLIVVSPPPLVTVDQTFTFVINCTAMGIPTPQVQKIGISKIVKTVTSIQARYEYRRIKLASKAIFVPSNI